MQVKHLVRELQQRQSFFLHTRKISIMKRPNVLFKLCKIALK